MTELIGTAFITGGAQGIGLGIARACAARGMKLALVDIDQSALTTAADELGELTQVVTKVLDVRDREAFSRVADEVEHELGEVSLLCNNAGVAGNTTVENMSYDAWDWVIGINLTGVYNGLQVFVPRMIARGQQAHIVNTASGAGLLGSGAGFLYSASKFGVVGLSESLRTSLAPHKIGVTVLCPSAVDTQIIKHTTGMAPETGGASVMTGMDDHLKFFAKMLKAGSDPDEVGRMVLAGVDKDQQYVLTDDLLQPWLQKRTAEIVAAMPDVGQGAVHSEG